VDIDLPALIRTARTQAGISQMELARRLGTTQSVISRWERGRDEPRLSTLARILGACGRRLVLRAEPDDVDRAQIRAHLAMTPAQRLAAVTNVSAALAGARRVP
jgi:transcriptional regulator with XRE-family HTH domain